MSEEREPTYVLNEREPLVLPPWAVTAELEKACRYVHVVWTNRRRLGAGVGIYDERRLFAAWAACMLAHIAWVEATDEWRKLPTHPSQTDDGGGWLAPIHGMCWESVLRNVATHVDFHEPRVALMRDFDDATTRASWRTTLTRAKRDLDIRCEDAVRFWPQCAAAVAERYRRR
ncbi:MAG TPA: hypothetical protein VF183_05575 [Acidimicrobiales bacterium]